MVVVWFVFSFLTFIGTCFVDISDGSGLDYVSNNKLLYCFILWNTAAAVCAVDVYDMSASVLGASTISSFLGLREVLVSKLVILFTVVSEYTLVFISIII